jgi:integrase
MYLKGVRQLHEVTDFFFWSGCWKSIGRAEYRLRNTKPAHSGPHVFRNTFLPIRIFHSTYTKYRDVYEKYIKKQFGTIPVDTLSPDYVTKTLPTNLSSSLYKSIYCVLNQILSYGNQYYGTPEIHLKLNRICSDTQPIQTINFTEQTKLRDYLLKDLDSYKLGILICLYMGLRLGEICALKWEDIDFSCKTLFSRFRSAR